MSERGISQHQPRYAKGHFLTARLYRWGLAAGFCAVILGTPQAFAAKIAIFRVDSLGVDALIVQRLEGLLRMEVNRLADESSPDPTMLVRLLRKRPALQECTGGVKCLTAVGKLLRVDQVISGNVGGLGDSYVLNLKIVDVAQQKELRRIQETISGQPDQLIEAIRVATYGLIAPDRLRGALSVLTSVNGADVYLDGTLVGQTPLPVQHGLPVRVHTLRVTKQGYSDVIERVKVRFQKTAEVMIKLETPKQVKAGANAAARRQERMVPWYTRWWFWTAVGVVAAGAGTALGLSVSRRTGVNCALEPARCGL